MRPRPLSALLAVTTGAAMLPALAGAADRPLEQFNRATGVAGPFGLIESLGSTRLGGVTDNGRYVFFSLFRSDTSPDNWLKDANPGEGLWVRDTLQNRTTRISSDGRAAVTGIDRTQQIVSFVTTEGLSSADTNGKLDLYAYNPLTGIKLLISRSGLSGPATGLTGYGTVTRGSTVAVYTTATGIQRRELLTGRTTKIGNGSFIGLTEESGALGYSLTGTADQYVSNDGRTVVTDQGLLTPSGVTPFPVDEEYGLSFTPFVNEAGTRLVWQESRFELTKVKTRTLPNGPIKTVPLPAGLPSNYGFVTRATPDGTAVLVQYIDFTGPSSLTQTTKKWNLTTGAVSDLSDLALISRNEKFGITGSRAGAYLVGPTPGNTLPGGIDLPAATAYVGYAEQCGYNPETDSYDQREVSVYPERVVELPAASTVRFQASAGPGKPVTLDQTVTVPTQDGYDPSKIVVLPSTDGAFRLDLTVTLADGRTITQRVDHVARPASCQ